MFKNTASVELNPKTDDLTGMQFGRLLVLAFDGYHKAGGFSSAYWWCRCDCGEEKSIQARFLKNGLTKSCGCLQRERASQTNQKPPGVADLNKHYRNYKSGAKTRGHSWKLTKEQVRQIFMSDCHYCGQESTQDRRSGIDRVDNGIGYEFANCVPCCSICNYAKRDMDKKDFLAWVKRISSHQEKLEGVGHL